MAETDKLFGVSTTPPAGRAPTAASNGARRTPFVFCLE